MQRGAATALILVGIGAIVVLIGAYIAFGGEPSSEPQQDAPLVAVAEELPQGTKNVRKTRSFVVLDNNFAYAGGQIYYRSGRAQDGEPLFSVMPVAEPEAFHKIGEAAAAPGHSSLATYSGGGTYAQSAYQAYSSSGGTTAGATSESSPSAGGNVSLGSAVGSGSPGYSVSYYTDGQNVYVIVETTGGTSEPQVVVGADPDTFEVINAEYASDDTSVYVVTVTCIGEVCNATVSIVPSADPDTFQVYANEQSILNSDCSGYVTADSQDGTHVYNNGQIVHGISVYLIGQGGDCDNTPVLISP